MNTFKADTTYFFGYAGNGNTTDVVIVRRTEKTIWFKMHGKEEQRVKIHADGSGEYFYPCGQYSMAPICRAKRIREATPVKEATPATTPAPREEDVVVVKMPTMYVVDNTPVEEVKEEEVLAPVDTPEEEVRRIAATHDVNQVEVEGLVIITDTIYGALSVAYTHDKKYMVKGAVSMETTDRDLFIKFLSSSYELSY